MTNFSKPAIGRVIVCWGITLTPQVFAQSVGSGPLTTSSLPASGIFTLIAMLLGVVAIAYAALNKKKNYITAIAGPALVLTSTVALVASPELRALPSIGTVQFTNPNGELIDVSTEYNNFTFDFEFTNVSGVPLTIKSVTEPDGCPVAPDKTSIAPQEKGNQPPILQDSGYPNCEVGLILNNGETCYKDFLPDGCIA